MLLKKNFVQRSLSSTVDFLEVSVSIIVSISPPFPPTLFPFD